VAARRSRDFLKPQFVDFSSPLLVRLFARLPGDLPNYVITIEECLPAVSQLPVAQGQPFATELVLQVAFPARGVPEAFDV
jgi:hypothetical protein